MTLVERFDSDDFDLTQTDALLSTTRSVRKRLDLTREVPDDVVLECLRLAVQSPTGSNNQGWRWLVVRDADTKEKLAEIYRRGGGEYLANGAANAEEGTQSGRVATSANYLAEHLGEVPVLVIPLIIGRLDQVSDSPNTAAAAGLMGSILPATWTFQLALRSRGLGSCYTTLHLNEEAAAADVLGIPPHMTQAGLIPVAYTTGTSFRSAQRPPVEEITYLDRYKNPIR
ncbi:nitroreductase family protein [Gordonia humi]|uniref:Nitroreductase n=1 Tax=Gordonia humi TaxID=686429 RepID=A0A840EZN9_9ACTN|nr:nitroreductase family protein [Gordonia humi]MBB4133600.1 nitroreductase [Gordonia humi]